MSMSSRSIQGPPIIRFDRTGPLLIGLTGTGLAVLIVMIPWAFAVISAAGILVLSALENELFMLSIIFLTPVSWVVPQDVAVRDVATTVHLLVASGFFMGRLLRGLVAVKELLSHPIARASLLFLAAGFASVALGTEGWTHESARTLVRFGSYVGFYFVVVAWVKSQERLRSVLLTLLTSTVLVGLFAVLQEALGGYTRFWLALNPPDESFVLWEGRASSFLSYANSLAGYLNLVLPLALVCYLTGSSVWKSLGGWTLLLGATALAFTQSRGGLVAFGCVIVGAIFHYAKGWPKKAFYLFALGAVALSFYLVGSVLNPEHLGTVDDMTAASRLLFWGTAWSLFLGSPLFGIGVSNFQVVYGSYIHLAWIPQGQFGVHNLYLQLLSETGLLGFVTFFLVLLYALRESRRQLHSSDFFAEVLGFGVLGAVAATLIHGFVDFVLEASPQFGTMFWILLALLVANARLASGCPARAKKSEPGGAMQPACPVSS